jgi:hypothetical protein
MSAGDSISAHSPECFRGSFRKLRGLFLPHFYPPYQGGIKGDVDYRQKKSAQILNLQLPQKRPFPPRTEYGINSGGKPL